LRDESLPPHPSNNLVEEIDGESGSRHDRQRSEVGSAFARHVKGRDET
jgi:hypothetical protein